MICFDFHTIRAKRERFCERHFSDDSAIIERFANGFFLIAIDGVRVHTCVHAYLHTCVHAYIHTRVCMRTYVYSHERFLFGSRHTERVTLGLIVISRYTLPVFPSGVLPATPTAAPTRTPTTPTGAPTTPARGG